MRAVSASHSDAIRGCPGCCPGTRGSAPAPAAGREHPEPEGNWKSSTGSLIATHRNTELGAGTARKTRKLCTLCEVASNYSIPLHKVFISLSLKHAGSSALPKQCQRGKNKQADIKVALQILKNSAWKSKCCYSDI